MKRLIALIGLAALVFSAMVTVASSSWAGDSRCAVTWGSRAKAASSTSVAPDTSHLTGVRTGRHNCYDRLVIDLDGSAPGYRVAYVKQLVQDGSGLPVEVAGGAILHIVARAPAYNDMGHATLDVKAVDAKNLSAYRTFRDLAFAGSFEGQTTLGLGVRARLPFRVFTLAGPGDGSRLVIDVAYRW